MLMYCEVPSLIIKTAINYKRTGEYLTFLSN